LTVLRDILEGFRAARAMLLDKLAVGIMIYRHVSLLYVQIPILQGSGHQREVEGTSSPRADLEQLSSSDSDRTTSDDRR